MFRQLCVLRLNARCKMLYSIMTLGAIEPGLLPDTTQHANLSVTQNERHAQLEC